MTFPFSVRYKKSLKAAITSENQEQILQYIKKRLLEKKADNVVVRDVSVSYEGSTSNWRGSLCGSVDDGSFKLVYENNNWFLHYQINMRELFIGTSILATLMETVVLTSRGPWWIGIAMFLWLCGGNWIVNLIGHESIAATIAIGIDELTCGKPKLPEEEDKMKGELKSWF